MDREQIIQHMMQVSRLYRAPGLTDRRLYRMLPRLLRHRALWIDMMRHGLHERTILELQESDPATYEHAVANFWSIVNQLSAR